jgi:hypothetical protein
MTHGPSTASHADPEASRRGRGPESAFERLTSLGVDGEHRFRLDRRTTLLLVALVLLVALLGVLLEVNGNFHWWFLVLPISLLALRGMFEYGRSRHSEKT